MPYDLLKDINTTVKDDEAHIQYMEEGILALFGDKAAYTLEESTEIWDAAPDSEKVFEMEGGAAMGRSAERDFVQSAREEEPSSSLGIKSDRQPKVGEWVLMPGAPGRITEIDTQDMQVHVKGRAGEKVFKIDELLGPKKTRSGELAWTLAGMQRRG